VQWYSHRTTVQEIAGILKVLYIKDKIYKNNFLVQLSHVIQTVPNVNHIEKKMHIYFDAGHPVLQYI